MQAASESILWLDDPSLTVAMPEQVEIFVPLPPDAIAPTPRTSQVPLEQPTQLNSISLGCLPHMCISSSLCTLRAPHEHLLCISDFCSCMLPSANTCEPAALAAQGSAVYVPEKDAMCWRIKNFPGGREFLMRCRFALPSVAAEEVPVGRCAMSQLWLEVC